MSLSMLLSLLNISLSWSLCVFSNTVYLRLIWSRVFRILSAMSEKSVPYCLISFNRVEIYSNDHLLAVGLLG